MKPIRRLLFVGLSAVLFISLACNFTSPVALPFLATPTATPIPLPPVLAETIPPAGSEISVRPTILFYFSQPMDRASVEAAMSNSLNLPGIFSWPDNATLAFTASQEMPQDSPITFTLASGVLAANGLASLEAQTIEFRASGGLVITQTLPADGATDVTPVSAVVATFNQPMVPLGAEPVSLPSGFSLQPAAPGRGEWLNTSTYIFYPDPALDGGATYIAQVNPDLVSVSGVKIDRAKSWSFTTSTPRVVTVEPFPNQPLGLAPEFTITFNQPMDTVSVEAGLRLEGPAGPVKGKFDWNENASVLVFTPAGLLQRGSDYSLVIPRQVQSRGGATLEAESVVPYRTYPDFAVTYFPSPNSPKGYRDSFLVGLSAPLREYPYDELLRLVSVSPAVPDLSVYADDLQLRISGSFSAGIEYAFTLSADLEDRWGQKTGQPVTFRGATFPPDPQLFIPYYLADVFVRPEEPLMTIQVSNLQSLEITTAPLSLDQYFAFASYRRDLRTYQPANAVAWSDFTGTGQATTTYDLRLDNSSQPLATGLYYLKVNSSQLSQQFPRSPQIMLVSNVNVTLKIDARTALVWVVDLRTGLPAANASVKVYTKDGVEIAGGLTGADGLWQGPVTPNLDMYDSFYAVIGQTGEDLFGLGSTAYSLGLSAWDFDINQDYGGERTQAYLYTDRPVYRPGDTVSFRGILRRAFNGRYGDLPDLQGWTVELLDEQGGVLQSRLAEFSEFGAFNGQFALPVQAQPGSWHLQLRGPNKGESFSIYFDVADYRKPEVNLAVNFSSGEFQNGQVLAASVNAQYFFGAPVSDLPVEWRLYRRADYFRIPGGFSTGKRDALFGFDSGVFGTLVESGQGRTGPEGRLELAFPDVTAEERAVFTLEVTASETGGFPVSANGEALFHPAINYVGVRPSQWVGRAGTALGFDLALVDLQNRPVGTKTLKTQFLNVVWERDANSPDYSPRYKATYTLLDSKDVQLDASGLGQVSFTPSAPGTYVLRASHGESISEAMVWVGGAGQAVWPSLPYDQVKLTADQETYRPGETAGVFLPNPFDQPAQALLTTERGQVLGAQLLTVPVGGTTVSLSMTDENAPNTIVSATLLGPGNTFRFGMIDLPVDAASFILNVEVKATPEKARPGDKLTLDLRVTDSKGQPVRGEFSLAVVDLAALALADPNSEEIVPAFYDIQPLGVRTGLTAAVYGQRFLQQAGGKGGGGSDAILTIREDFPDTALWTTFVTDASGKAQASLTLPDSLTTWQVDARGLDLQTRVGQARLNVVTTKDLLLRPLTPRYFVVGDHVQLGALVNNNTNADLKTTVSLQANGVALDDPAQAEQTVTVPANGRATVTWWVRALDGDHVELVFAARSGNLSDATRPVDGELPILRYTVPQTFSTSGILGQAGTRREIVSLPRSFAPQGGSLTIEMAPSMGAYLLDAFESIAPPDEFSSNEEIASYILAELSLLPALKSAGIESSRLDGAREAARILAGKLLKNQNADGGWNWYRIDWVEVESDPLISAHVLLALTEAGKAGLLTNAEENLARANSEYITAQIRIVPDMENTELDRQVLLVYASLAQFAASQAGGEVLWLDSLYALRERLSPSSRALLALAYSNLGQAAPEDLLSNLEGAALRSATGAYWDNPNRDWSMPNHPRYTTAVVLAALAERGGEISPLMQDAVRYLVANRPSRGWQTSAETAWTMRALSLLLDDPKEMQPTFGFSAILNGARLAEGQANPAQRLDTVTRTVTLADLVLAGPNDLLIEHQAGEGNLYYRADLQVLRPVESAPAINQGISVLREYLDCAARPCKPVSEWQMAETASRLTVRVTVTVPQDMYYVNVEDYAPAGAEIVNPNLKTSQQGEQTLDVDYYEPDDPYAFGWGWWYFDAPKIYRDHIRWSAEFLPAGTYVLSYTLTPSLPGEYRAIPARAWLTYFPEMQGASAGSLLTIRK
jgi:hypothetical protein